MSVDRSLKSRDALSRHRNVLTRAERLEKLVDDGIWEEESDSVFGLPKVAHRKEPVGKKSKKSDAEAEAGAETAESSEKGGGSAS